MPAGLFQQRTQISVGSLRGLDALEEMTLGGLTRVANDGSRGYATAQRQAPDLRSTISMLISLKNWKKHTKRRLAKDARIVEPAAPVEAADRLHFVG